MAANDSGSTRVTFLTPEKQDEDEKSKKLDKLTVKYNRKEIQCRIHVEEWIESKIQELYHTEEELKNKAVEPDIDIDDLLELSAEEQKSRLQEILKECSRPTEDFILELIQRLKGLKKISVLHRK